MIQARFRQLFDLPGDADTRRRGSSLILIALVLLGANFLGMVSIFIAGGNSIVSLLSSSGLSMASMVLAIILTRRQRIDFAGWMLIVGMTISLIPSLYFTADNGIVVLYLSIPVVVSGLILRPWQVWLVALAALAMMLVKASFTPEIARSLPEIGHVLNNAAIATIILGAVSQLSAQRVRASLNAADSAGRAAADSAAQLEQLNADLERQVQARTAELRAAFSEAEARANEKQALLDKIATQRTVIREMSVPVLPVRAGTLVMPLVGELDSERLAMIESRALAAIETLQAHTLLIDLTGVSLVDTYVAQHLLRTIQAARLLGARPMLIGIRPEVAQAIVGLGIDVGDVGTAASLESALSPS